MEISFLESFFSEIKNLSAPRRNHGQEEPLHNLISPLSGFLGASVATKAVGWHSPCWCEDRAESPAVLRQVTIVYRRVINGRYDFVFEAPSHL